MKRLHLVDLCPCWGSLTAHLFEAVIISNRTASYGLSIRGNIVEMEKGRGTMRRSMSCAGGAKIRGAPAGFSDTCVPGRLTRPPVYRQVQVYTGTGAI